MQTLGSTASYRLPTFVAYRTLQLMVQAKARERCPGSGGTIYREIIVASDCSGRRHETSGAAVRCS